VGGASDLADLENDSASEEYLQNALKIIGEYKILSPLLVLEIVQAKKTLKFKVLRNYLLNRLKQQDEVIKKSKRKVDENMEHIQKMQNEIVEIKTQARLFSTKDCV
jgi:hypothetical protein